METTLRRLAAILSADLVGYSRLMEADESGTISALHALHQEVWGPKIVEHGGRLISTAGDSLLVEYPSSLAAVLSAAEIQEAMWARSKDKSDDQRFLFRIGVNVGDVVVDGDDLLGDGVNIAARLEGICTPGGVCISESVSEHLTGKLEVKLSDLGKVRLKNIKRELRAFELTEVPESGVKLPFSPRTRRDMEDDIDFSRFDRASIVILPFRDLGGADRDCLGEGLRLSLHAVLIKLSGLFLLHTAAVEKFRDRDFSPAEIGLEIDVQYVVSGAVQRGGDRVRILVDLTDVATGRVIWAERLDQTLDDIFKFQDEIAREIVNAIGVELRGGEDRRELFKTASSAEALAYLHRAVSHLYRGTREDTAKARDWGEKLLELEPEHPSALGFIALTYWRDAKFGWSDDVEASLNLARNLAERAVENGDPEGIGKTIMAYVHLHARNYEEALAASMAALSHRPSCPLSNGILSDVLRYCGDPENAVNRMKTAMELARSLPPWMVNTLAASLRDAGDLATSTEAALQAVQRYPDEIESKVTLCCDHVLTGSDQAAQKVAAQILRTDPTFSVSSYIATQPYKEAATLETIASALKKAGLPD